MVICLERGADLHMARLMPLPLTVSCFSKIRIGFTFLVPAHLGSPGQRAVKRVCVCVLKQVCIQLHTSADCVSLPASGCHMPLLWHGCCRAPAMQHLIDISWSPGPQPSGILSCWPDGLELTPGFYPASSEQYRLF